MHYASSSSVSLELQSEADAVMMLRHNITSTLGVSMAAIFPIFEYRLKSLGGGGSGGGNVHSTSLADSTTMETVTFPAMLSRIGHVSCRSQSTKTDSVFNDPLCTMLKSPSVEAHT